MELLEFITQDAKHVIGTIVFGWLIYEGLIGIIKAFKNKK